MFHLSSEARARHRLVEQSITNAREVFVTTPEVQNRLGSLANTLIQLCDLAYIPNVKDGVVSIPKRYQGEERVPVVAMSPNDQWRLSADFAKLVPSQHNQAIALLDSWQPKLSTSTTILGNFERDATAFTASSGGKKIANCFSGNPNILAMVTAGRTEVPFDLTHFANAGTKSVKQLWTSPLMCLRYEGSQSSPVGSSTMAHEQFHALQFWKEGLCTALTDEQKKRQWQYRQELQATAVGACVAIGLFEAGHELTAGDHKELLVERERTETNEGRQDPFDPNGTLIKRLREQQLDLVFD